MTCKCWSQSPKKPSTSFKPAWLKIVLLDEVSVSKLIYSLFLLGSYIVIVLQELFQFIFQVYIADEAWKISRIPQVAYKFITS